MGVFTTPTQLRVRQRARFEQVKRDIKKVHRIMAEDGETDFHDATDGKIKSKQLAAMGHPFGRLSSGDPRTGGRGAKDGRKFIGAGIKGQVTRKGVVRPLPINEQTGRLKRGITLTGPLGGRRSEYRLFTTVPYAKYVLRPGGTRKMVDRGLLGPRGFLRKRHKARIAAYIDVVRKSNRKP